MVRFKVNAQGEHGHAEADPDQSSVDGASGVECRRARSDRARRSRARDRLDLLRGRRVGVLCHPASVTSDLDPRRRSLIAAGVRPARLFGPEHGVRGEAQDMIGVADGRDARTGIPVTSLYGETFESLTPTAAELDGLDVLVVDLQDVGSRYYTYVWTMALALRRGGARAASRSSCSIGRTRSAASRSRAATVAGRLRRRSSGWARCPVRHGLTIGEVARLVAAGMPWGGAALRAAARLRPDGGRDARLAARDDVRRDGPALGDAVAEHADARHRARLSGAVPVRGRPTCPRGAARRGRSRSSGAPFLDGHALGGARSRRRSCRACACGRSSFRRRSTSSPGKACGGVQLHVTDAAAFRPYRTGVALIAAARELGAATTSAGAREPYEFVADPPAIDLLTGSARSARRSRRARRSRDIERQLRRRSSARSPSARARALAGVRG